MQLYCSIKKLKMKSNKKSLWAKNMFTLIFATCVVLTVTSCAKKVNFQTSVVVPAARGQVKVKKDKNKNYDVQVRLFNLAEVSRLQPPKNAYVIWLMTEDQIIKNIGQIKSSTAMISKKLKGKFETVTAFKPVKIFITAEDEANAQYPSSQLIITTNAF